MLRELNNVRQIDGESRRRCFSDADSDLTVWVAMEGTIIGFEFCYDKGKHERALRWNRVEGYLHQRVDDGERRELQHKATPILVPDGVFDRNKISRLFLEKSRDIDSNIADLVLTRISEYSE